MERFLLILIGFALAPHGFAADLFSYTVGKGALYQQTNAAETIPAPRPFVRETLVIARPGSVGATGGYLYPPSGGPAWLSVTYSSRIAEHTAFAASQSALDQTAPPGVYRLECWTGIGDRLTNYISLTGAPCPNPPIVDNFQAAQAINPAADFELRWQPFAAGTDGDLITFAIYGYPTSHGGPLLETPVILGAAGTIKGTATSFVIPAGTLAPGHVYLGRLRFEKIASTNFTDTPGAQGRGALFASTDFHFATIGAGKPPRLLSISPRNGSTGVPRDTALVWTFDRPMRRSFSLDRTGPLRLTNEWSTDSFMLQTRFAELLGTNESHYSILNRWGVSLLMRDQNGDPLLPEHHNSFRTGITTNTAAPPAAPELTITNSLADLIHVTAAAATSNRFMIQASTNFTNWSLLSFNASSNSTLSATDTNTLPRRFYRAVVVP